MPSSKDATAWPPPNLVTKQSFAATDGIVRKGISDLFDRIWGLDIESEVSQSAPYLQHYELVHTMIDGSFISFPDWQSVIDLLDEVK